MSELDDPTPPAEIPTGHMANATDWRAVCTKPDFCRVGKDVIAFDSYALLTTVHTSSPNVLAQSQKVYREGDFFKVIQSNAGAHIVSGTSLESGFCKILTGQSTVCVNGKPVACHNSYVMLNCNAAGEGGTTGKVATEPPKPAPKPDSKKDGLLDIDPMAALINPKGELEKLKKKMLGRAKGEINAWLKESPVGQLLTEIKKADEKLNSMVRPVINQAKEWFGQTPVGKFVSGFRSENKRVEEEYVKDRVGGFKTLWEAIPFTSDAATSAAARGRIQESLVNSLNVIGALMGPSQEQILAASVSGSREDWKDIEAQQKIQQQTAEAIVEGVRGATEGAYNRGGIGGVAGFFGTHIAIFVAECAVGGEVASVAGKVASFSGKAISKGAMEAADVIKGIANVAKTPAQAVELTEAAVNAAKLAGAGEGKMGPLLAALKAVKEQKVLAEELAKKAAEMKKGVHVNPNPNPNPKPKPKLPTATDATATSPDRSNRDYGKTTMTDANGNRIPTEPSLPGELAPKVPEERGLSVTYTDPATGVKTINPTASVSGEQLDRLGQSTAKPHEINLAAQLENATGSTIEMVERPPPLPNGDRPKSPDFVFKTGPYTGATGDFMFTDPAIKQFPNLNWPKTEKSLNAHLTKANILVLDFTNFNVASELKVSNWINSLTSAQRGQILIRR